MLLFFRVFVSWESKNSKSFRERYLNDAGFRSMYNEKLENRKNKKRERNKMIWNGEKIREAI